jgi:hypothetical protein
METVTGDQNGPHLLHDCIQHRVGNALQLRHQVLQKHGHKVEHHLQAMHSEMTSDARHRMPIVLLVLRALSAGTYCHAVRDASHTPEVETTALLDVRRLSPN